MLLKLRAQKHVNYTKLVVYIMRELGQERWKKIKNPRFEFTFEDGKISPFLSRKAISSKFV